MVLVGVTGGVGMGKTTVLQRFEAFGFSTLDADDIVHELYRPGTSVHSAVCRRWGNDIAGRDRAIDRGKLARLVFASPADLAWLNELIHPLVRRRFLQASERGQGHLFCGVPLLFEVGWQTDMASTIAVWCDPVTRRKRLRRRGWDEWQMHARLKHQLPAEEKLRRADFGIVNNADRSVLDEQCRRILGRLCPEN